ncbi:hypothetical protein N0B44_12170 [Roseibacterium beibuensis]|uniref:Uncharacterized protein n=1 Tax=[Roseibacterium] beibuensis TaxID=1193142 RepID=A0ABP9LEA9_9RHOB|nr:hypothetical protein [Roseibacterium beibuensis]MCS6623670.1 hypothetical protein [Roseibacterium beibuensis]
MIRTYDGILAKHPALLGSEPTDLKAFGVCCGPGWLPILKSLFDDFEKIRQEDGLTITVFQVKEKFGELRVYVRGGNDRVQHRLRDAEWDAMFTCEDCGGRSPGVQSLGGGLNNLCGACRKKLRQSWKGR